MRPDSLWLNLSVRTRQFCAVAHIHAVSNPMQPAGCRCQFRKQLLLDNPLDRCGTALFLISDCTPAPAGLACRPDARRFARRMRSREQTHRRVAIVKIRLDVNQGFRHRAGTDCRPTVNPCGRTTPPWHRDSPALHRRRTISTTKNMSTDEDIIRGLSERRGSEAAHQYAQQTLRVYRRAVLNPRHFASTPQYRRAFIMSYLFYKHYLRSPAPPSHGGGTPRSRPSSPASPPARRPSIEECERMIDEQLAGSFPASDPPSWTLGGSVASTHRPH